MRSVQSIISTLSLLIIFVMFVHQGSAIQCFECNSHNDSRCANNNPPQDLSIECGKHRHGVSYTFCRKITQVIEFSVNGLPPDSRVIRGCGVEDSAIKGKCYQRAGFGGRQEVCACYEDNCNGSSSLRSTFVTIGAAILLIATYFTYV